MVQPRESEVMWSGQTLLVISINNDMKFGRSDPV